VDFDVSPQSLTHDVVDDVQAKAATATAATRGEEGVEDAAQVFGWNALAIVLDAQAHIAAAATLGQDADGAAWLLVKTMDHGIDQQIGDDLRDGARIAVQQHIVLALDMDAGLGAFEAWFQAGDDFIQIVVQLEITALFAGLVHRHLLEAMNQIGGFFRIGQNQLA